VGLSGDLGRAGTSRSCPPLGSGGSSVAWRGIEVAQERRLGPSSRQRALGDAAVHAHLGWSRDDETVHRRCGQGGQSVDEGSGDVWTTVHARDDRARFLRDGRTSRSRSGAHFSHRRTVLLALNVAANAVSGGTACAGFVERTKLHPLFHVEHRSLLSLSWSENGDSRQEDLWPRDQSETH
jgi:hypothetical protein